MLSLFQQDKLSSKCGCYVRNPRQIGVSFKKALVPLRHIDYHLQIVNSLVQITLVQKYFNPTDKYLEVEYSLPISPESSIYRFYAQFNNVKIEGIVKQKQQAKKAYQQAKKQGKQVAMGSLDSDSKDIMNMEIGNIPPNTQFSITLSLLQQLKITQNTFYKLHIPSSISPRYVNHVQGIAKIPQHMKQKGQLSGEADFTWNFKIDLKTQRKVIFYNSSSHKLSMISQNQNKTQTTLVMEKSEIPNKDFIFLYTTQDFHLPSYVIGKTDNSTTVMLSFIPKFCTLDINDAYKAEIQHKSFNTDLYSAKGDYVFFLDRSGSMGGARIQKAKQALIMFLRSLPEDSYFNIISFGDRYDNMFGGSQRYTQKSSQQAIKKVQSMSANMGGTQIYNPLKTLLQQKGMEGYPRHIFILTDGEVSNTEGVIKMVKNNTKYCRVHCIGIGNGASLNLIQGCSKNGKGNYVMITDSENPSNKIIQLLQTSLTPLISKVNLKLDQNNLQSIVPNPKSIPYILKDQIVNFYINYASNLSQTKHFIFEYEDSVTKLPYKTQIDVDFNKSQNMIFVDKMAHLKVLRSLQRIANENQKVEDHMFYVKVKDNKEQAIKYSIKHQILSQFTAFICIGKQLIDGQYQQYIDKGSKSIKVQQPKPIQKSYRNFDDLQMMDCMSSAQLGVQDQMKCFDKLQDILLDCRSQAKMRQCQLNDKLKDLCADSDDDDQQVDDLLRELQQQVKASKSMKMAMASKPTAIPPTKNKQNQIDQIQRMLMELGDDPVPKSPKIVPDVSQNKSSLQNQTNLAKEQENIINTDQSNITQQNSIPKSAQQFKTIEINTIQIQKQKQRIQQQMQFKKQQHMQQQLQKRKQQQQKQKAKTKIQAQQKKKIKEEQEKAKVKKQEQQKKKIKAEQEKARIKIEAQKPQGFWQRLFGSKVQTTVDNTVKNENKIKQQQKPVINTINYQNVQQIIKLQSFNGSWSQTKIIDSLCKNHQQILKIVTNDNKDIIVTDLIIKWMRKHYSDQQYSLIIKKAQSWLNKVILQRKFDIKLTEKIQCI